ncbi:MDR family oxidoreductase [Aquabacterium sp. J223]|uniref:acrylyl-CoA reductase (NADPH) n=1 Tax=Aquabacterium sp. J223 TaxID=2898431 RepID=UPI0021AE11B4|nr:MDR family oxidoreductase [Aquabacterium sp. J223]UUX97529.1 oxidoreductase [Aquabacterium sp. J223]
MFQALLIEKAGEKAGEAQTVRLAALEDDALPEGEVTVQVAYSTLNFKDALALTGRSPIVRQYPMVPGIDFAGTVLDSRSPRFKPGDEVLLNGWGVGEGHWGGLAQRARVKADWLQHRPPGMSARDAMAIGTAGYTAMLCLMALEEAGMTPAQGEALVTGASGGVGSIAIALLSRHGWQVTAATGKPAEADGLKRLGATGLLDRATLSAPSAKPLQKERWAVAVDSVGSHTLVNVLAQMKQNGAVAACGLAQGMDLPGSVAPFILRGVRLLGVNSVLCPLGRRERAWQRLSTDLDLGLLAPWVEEIGLDQAPATAERFMTGSVRGRIVVRVG